MDCNIEGNWKFCQWSGPAESFECTIAHKQGEVKEELCQANERATIVSNINSCRLVLEDVTEEDAGQYECVAITVENGASVNDRMEVGVDIAKQAELEFDHDEDKIIMLMDQVII